MARQQGANDLVIVQTTIPDYRTRFFAALVSELDGRVVLVSGDEDWTPDVRHAGGVPHVRVRNVYLAGRRVLWQSGALKHGLGADVLVLTLNPRILTNWVALVVRRLRRRRTVLWGHAWPRQGVASRTDRVRSVMRRLASSIIVYTETDAIALARARPGMKVSAAPNSLYSESELGPVETAPEVTDFVCVGRLIPAKKPGLLLEAFLHALPSLDEDVRLVVVGDGPLRAELEQRATSSGASERIVFTGHASDLDALRAVYARAIASVSPGYVGLSLTQSLGFGVPMLIAREEPHAPEVEAAVEGENSYMFSSDSVEELARLLVTMASDRASWLARRPDIAARARAIYTIESMVRAFVANVDRR